MAAPALCSLTPSSSYPTPTPLHPHQTPPPRVQWPLTLPSQGPFHLSPPPSLDLSCCVSFSLLFCLSFCPLRPLPTSAIVWRVYQLLKDAEVRVEGACTIKSLDDDLTPIRAGSYRKEEFFPCPSWAVFWGSVTKNIVTREKHIDLFHVSFYDMGALIKR